MEQVMKDPGKAPVKLWLSPEEIEDTALEQIAKMAEMPMIYKHLAIMPDCHFGKGATIGAVMALEGAVVPNCVGVDIGCGMATYRTGLKFEGDLAERNFWRDWKGKVDRNIPTGFNAHDKMSDERHDNAERYIGGNWSPLPGHLRCAGVIAPAKKYVAGGLLAQINQQLGTLGGGNHFIEAQRDADGEIWIMVHSGSRGVGLKIAEHYDRQAKFLNTRWRSPRPEDLNWLPLDDEVGRHYLADMNWAVSYALANRIEMLRQAVKILGLTWDSANVINIPHNYAAIENHFGSNVVVHRKGATRARDGEIGIIPGSMGTKSYIVRGKGNQDSFQSCSHGAGRRMGRKRAFRELDTDQFHESIKHTFSSATKDCLDECPAVYKAIETVMERQRDLVDIVHELEPIITVKGGNDEVLD